MILVSSFRTKLEVTTTVTEVIFSAMTLRSLLEIAWRFREKYFLCPPKRRIISNTLHDVALQQTVVTWPSAEIQ